MYNIGTVVVIKTIKPTYYNMENITVNVFTCCDGIYKDFIPLFILSNLYHNEECFVEISVDTLNYKPIQTSISMLKQKYPNRFLIREVDFKGVTVDGTLYQTSPNTVRFYVEPEIKSNYVYISDIDIIVLVKNFHEQHITHMSNSSLPYSNIVRPFKDNSLKRLTGLHFTPYNNYYPIPEFNDLCKLNLLSYDEPFLYELVKKRHSNFKYDETFRPVHGIHASLNREPTGQLNWELPRWKQEWISFTNDEYFKKIEPTFTDLIKKTITKINNYYNESNNL